MTAKKGFHMSEIKFDSTEMDTEFDILEEMIKTLKDIDSICQKPADREIREKINYMKFLLDELDDAEASRRYQQLMGG